MNHTIILITHDTGIAQQAKRIVRIQDGKIFENADNILDLPANPIQ
jgi:putative ABC transport system ATP-binding protein